ncbi:MAG: LysR family transcriptional regulator [Methylobacillus glycogenes]|nr:LysR family transcriptional regulator [Methylobacillus glycogenes]
MNLRDLNYLVAVADCRNFSQAANQCAIGQPTLSVQIKKLEDYLDVPLFVRHKNQVLITDTGAEIVEVARRIIADSEQIRHIAAQAQTPVGGKLSLGAFPSVASYVLPEYVFRIKQHYPEMKMMVIEEKTQSLIELMLQMKLDAALLALPVTAPELESSSLFVDPFTLAVASDHPLAGEQEVDLTLIKQENLLLLDEGHCLRDQALEVCHPSRFVEDDFRASSLETLRFMVKNGLGVTLMPSVAIQPEDGDIRYIAIKQQPSRTIALVWHKQHPRRRLFQELACLLAYKPLA